MLRTAAPLLLAALLLLPVNAPAQAPLPAKAPAQRVSIQVTFVTVKTQDLDALGINFDFLSVPGASATYIRGATDSRASYIYRMLTRTPTPADTYVFSILPHEAADNVAATFAFDAEIPAPAASGAGPVQRDEKVTLIPQVVPGNFVKLVMLSPLSHTQQMPLYTVPSGQQIVFNTAVVSKAQDGTGRGRLQRVSGHIKVAHTTELLIFITPTIVSEAPKTVNEPTTFVPPTHFLGADAGNPFAGTGFDQPFAGSFSDASSGLLGFGMTKPSDIFRFMSSPDFSRWQSRSRKTGTMSKPSPVIKSTLPSGVKRIFAL